jgi:hypothetical protein
MVEATEQGEIVRQIAEQLHEPNVPLVALVVDRLGEDAALGFLRQTLEIEAQGGLLIASGKRRRTPGGVFFHLVKQSLSEEDVRTWWPEHGGRKRGKTKAGAPAKAKAEPPAYEECLTWAPEALQQPGEATTVKITLIGRPGRIVERGDVVLTMMQGAKAPTLPKGLPVPPAEPTTYVVYIARKQWARVAEAIQDPDDKLIVEGYPAFEKRLGAVVVFATQVTTKNLQAAKREREG